MISERQKRRLENISNYNKRKEKELHVVFQMLDSWAKRNIDDEVTWRVEFDSDYGDILKLIQARFKGGNINVMPVSTMTCESEIKAIRPVTGNVEYLGNASGYKIEGRALLHPIGKMVYEREYSKMGNYRLFATSMSELRGNEVKFQMKRQAANRKVIEDMLQYVKPFREWAYNCSLAVYLRAWNLTSDSNIPTTVLDTMIKYAREHTGKSCVKGVKYDTFIWKDIRGEVDMEKSRLIMERLGKLLNKRFRNIILFLRRWKERLINGKEIPCFKWDRLITGIRTRRGTAEVEEAANEVTSVENYEFQVNETVMRMRWVIGIFGVSHPWMCIEEGDITRIEREQIAKLQLLVCWKIETPIVAGGDIWKIVTEKVKEYGLNKTYTGDGTGWECHVGVLLHPFGCVWLGFIALASGIALTTLFGVAAMAAVVEILIIFMKVYDVDIGVIFGDDFLGFGNKMGDVKGVIEGKEEEQRYVVYLGVSIVLGHIIAFKLHRDKSDAAEQFKMRDVINRINTNKISEQRRIVTYIAYGFTDIVDCISLLRGYKGGGNVEEYMIDAYREVPEKRKEELKEFDTRKLHEYWNPRYIEVIA